MSKLARTLAIGLALLFSFAARAADPVAFLSDVKGEVVMNGSGRPPFLSELLPGTKLALGKDAAAAVMFVVSGEEFSLKGPGEFVVTREGVKASKGAAPSIRVPGLKVSAAAYVDTSRAATASLRMRSAPAPKGERSAPVYPVNTRIATLQPTLRWKGEPGAAYSVVVTSASGKEVFRGTAKGSSLALPARLQAGQGYTWSYSAGEATLGDAHFETLPADSIAAAEKARSGARTFSDRVLFAMVLQDLGAPQDAREVWTQLSAERPDLPELAKLAR